MHQDYSCLKLPLLICNFRAANWWGTTSTSLWGPGIHTMMVAIGIGLYITSTTMQFWTGLISVAFQMCILTHVTIVHSRLQCHCFHQLMMIQSWSIFLQPTCLGFCVPICLSLNPLSEIWQSDILSIITILRCLLSHMWYVYKLCCMTDFNYFTGASWCLEQKLKQDGWHGWMSHLHQYVPSVTYLENNFNPGHGKECPSTLSNTPQNLVWWWPADCCKGSGCSKNQNQFNVTTGKARGSNSMQWGLAHQA